MVVSLCSSPVRPARMAATVCLSSLKLFGRWSEDVASAADLAAMHDKSDADGGYEFSPPAGCAAGDGRRSSWQVCPWEPGGGCGVGGGAEGRGLFFCFLAPRSWQHNLAWMCSGSVTHPLLVSMIVPACLCGYVPVPRTGQQRRLV